MAATSGKYRLSNDNDTDPKTSTLGFESTYDRANAHARELSHAGLRVRVSVNNKSGRVLSIYENGREKFYTYAGGREFF